MVTSRPTPSHGGRLDAERFDVDVRTRTVRQRYRPDQTIAEPPGNDGRRRPKQIGIAHRAPRPADIPDNLGMQVPAAGRSVASWAAEKRASQVEPL